MKTKTSTYRLQYLDWVRGIGALIMLQGHVFDSFLKPDLRGGSAFVLSQFFGGMPPAIFLFLTGVTLAFLMDSTERKGLRPLERVSAAFRRSGYLFFLAFAFRTQMWITGWPAPWKDLLRVDILNCMGFAIATLSIMALFRTVERARLCAMLGLGIAFASPLISQMDWSWMPWLIRHYIVPDYAFFSFFPWAAYLAFGMSAGSIIRAIPPEATERMMQWAAVVGGTLILSCHYFSNLPYSIYAKSDYWLNSPAQVLTKQGVTLLLLAFAFLWTRYAAKDGWSWVRQFGTTSLLVYWVHIELVYGRWLYFLKNNLTVQQTVIAAGSVIALMLALSTIKTYRKRIATALEDLGWSIRKPDRVPGD
ncbi:MAG TPA: heparan-alpha-glucosaminide N-acetyltransferase domain-containing protein [Bryobacteraceae bacterium]|nr:heparan-alpha-glucosaminide N-acetyltransferase domain-containing protein [Bryobacteraceae bacterium]